MNASGSLLFEFWELARREIWQQSSRDPAIQSIQKAVQKRTAGSW